MDFLFARETSKRQFLVKAESVLSVKTYHQQILQLQPWEPESVQCFQGIGNKHALEIYDLFTLMILAVFWDVL